MYSSQRGSRFLPDARRKTLAHRWSIYLVFLVTLGKCSNDAPTFFAAHREESDYPVGSYTYMKCIVAIFPIKLYISDVEQSFKRAAFKREPERVPHQTLWPIATDQIFAFDSLGRPAAVANDRRNASIGLRKTLKF